MIAHAGWLAATLLLQVPAPDAAAKESASLHGQERAILDREAARLRSLGENLTTRGEKDAAAQVRRDLPLPPPADGATRFVPLAEIVPGHGQGLANVKAIGEAPDRWKVERETIRSESAAALFELATLALKSSHHYGLADACLHAVLARNGDHAEARRLLGFIPFQGGWATPFAAAKIKEGMILHPTYGWVHESWVAHLEEGKLPSRAGLSRGREVWIPAAQADAERSEFRNGWEIQTEHFQIKTNVPLSEAIHFGRHLETLYQVFQSQLADVIGENLPLARRFKTKAPLTATSYKPHLVSYYSTKAQFADDLRARQPRIDDSLGLYLPPERGTRGHAYFYQDNGGEIAVTATLYHEVSHQLLFESGVAKRDADEANSGNYWVFEGLGTYFETLSIEPDGSVRLGGLVGPRLMAARTSLVDKGLMVPLADFVRYGKNRFNEDRDIYLHYQEAAALATFLMQADDGAYREGFLDYVKSACQGRLKSSTSRTLETRVKLPYAEIEARLLAYLKGEAAK